MILQETKIGGVYLIEPEVKSDDRGSFARLFCQQELADVAGDFKVVQVNQSVNYQKGALRGLHFQKSPKAEDKLVRCSKGAIYDVAVELRQDSLTYGQWVAEELSQENGKMLLIPKGLAHGFQTLEDDTEVIYLMSEFYAPEYASGVRWNDPDLGISWPLEVSQISEKDKSLPLLKKQI